MIPDEHGGGKILDIRGNVVQRVEGIDELITEEDLE